MEERSIAIQVKGIAQTQTWECETAQCVWGMGEAKVSDEAGKVKRGYDLGL